MDGRELLEANLPLIHRVISFACRRKRLDADEAEEFAAVVRLKLVENDYAILRKFEGRSSLSTFIAVVVQRLLLDYRVHHWGKWHPSAEAQRLGDVAVELEKLVRRDGRSVEEARAVLQARFGPLPDFDRLIASLPQRAPRRTLVALEEAGGIAAESDPVPTDERRRTSERVSTIVARFLEALPPDDRLVLQLRFEEGLTVAQIARSMCVDQKPLYRRIERHLAALREEIERSGMAADDVASLIGDRHAVLDFRLSPRRAEEATR